MVTESMVTIWSFADPHGTQTEPPAVVKEMCLPRWGVIHLKDAEIAMVIISFLTME